MKILFKPLLTFSLIVLNSLALIAQADFSGVWLLDHSKSDAEFKDYQITCNIIQNTGTFSVEQIITMKNGDKSSMPAVVYNTDGKEVIREEQGGKDKYTAKFTSPDKKAITVKFVRTMDGNDYGSITTYKLSDDSRTLTIVATDLKGESPMTQVYKKQ
jgi:hypothetical protein